jgi:hypothetical protein
LIFIFVGDFKNDELTTAEKRDANSGAKSTVINLLSTKKYQNLTKAVGKSQLLKEGLEKREKKPTERKNGKKVGRKRLTIKKLTELLTAESSNVYFLKCYIFSDSNSDILIE